MTKILRMVRIVKVKNKLARHLQDILKIGAGAERLFFLIIMFFVLSHVVTCIWYGQPLILIMICRIFIGKYDETSKDNWIYKSQSIDSPDSDLYIDAFYFTITTLVTVGYGDITAESQKEKVLCCILMIMGVISFSYMTGSLSSIIASYDTSEAQLKEKISTLKELASLYHLD